MGAVTIPCCGSCGDLLDHEYGIQDGYDLLCTRCWGDSFGEKLSDGLCALTDSEGFSTSPPTIG